jgi:hypothetical protein
LPSGEYLYQEHSYDQRKTIAESLLNGTCNSWDSKTRGKVDET